MQGLATRGLSGGARKGKTASAIDLILARSTAETLGQPEKWASRRRSLTRAQMRQGYADIAYQLAAALEAFAQGAHHQTSFYGLLAAGREVFPPWQEAAFTRSDVFKAAIIAHGAQLPSLARRFFLQLAESQDRVGLGQLGQTAIDLGSPHIAVMLGKQAAKRGIVLPASYYPLHQLDLTVPAEFALAIARRESQF
jgi:soluble lytic murein transglycosylase